MAKPEESSFALHKLFIASIFHDVPPIKDKNILGVFETIEFVGDCESGGLFGNCIEALLYFGLIIFVQG
jgi:hypothetical protein